MLLEAFPRTVSIALGPILFLIYLKDLSDEVAGLMQLFAVNTKLHSNVENNQKVLALQNKLTRMETWAQDWQMLYNTLKCHQLHNFILENMKPTLGTKLQLMLVNKY